MNLSIQCQTPEGERLVKVRPERGETKTTFLAKVKAAFAKQFPNLVCEKIDPECNDDSAWFWWGLQ